MATTTARCDNCLHDERDHDPRGRWCAAVIEDGECRCQAFEAEPADASCPHCGKPTLLRDFGWCVNPLCEGPQP